ncbi:MAG: hypothetical protein HZC40_04260 [Chloroflexi bacterium]|nr:hypothetical protein [Chloroflexota bacterium]
MVAPLTKADEHGLRGVSLDSRLRQLFFGMPPEKLTALAQQVREEATRRELVYFRDGVQETINVMLRPAGIFSEQMNYFHYVALTLVGALKRMPELYLKDFNIREAVPLEDLEAKWLWDTWGASHNQYHTVFGRLDAIVDLTSPFWKDTLAFIEPNLVGVGGIHLIPTAEGVIRDVVVPALQEIAPDLDLEPSQDLRDLFILEVNDHAEAIGRKGRTICLVDPKYAGDGPNELETLTNYYRERGYEIYHADPTELVFRNNEVYYEGHLIDVAYRDYDTRDLAQQEKDGENMRAIKHLFKQNQIISSMAGDFDHKSCFEIFTDSRFSQYFSVDERNIFRHHVLWTRLLTERRSTDPHNEMIDLVEYVRKNREILVIKPNRSYGGEDILIGPSVTDGEWEDAIERAVRAPGAWVVQRLAKISVYEFPVIADDGTVQAAPFYVVVGLAPTKYGVAILGRASQKQVVNVAQRGGMLAVLVGRHAPRVLPPKYGT